MPFANGIDITSLIERIPVAGEAAKPVTTNQMVRDLSNMIKAMSRFEAKVEAGQKATLRIKINGETLKLSFDPRKDSPVEAVKFKIGGMEFSASDIDPQELVAMARQALTGVAPEGQVRELVNAVFGLVESLSGNLAGIDPVATAQGLTSGLGLERLPSAVTDAVGGLGSDPLGVLTSAIGNLGGGVPSGNPTSGNPAGAVVNPAAGPALDTVGQTGGNNTAPALDAFNGVNGGPVDFLFRVGSNTSTFNTGTDHTTPVREGAQGGVPSLPAAPGVPAVPALPGAPSLPGLPAAPGVPALPGAPGLPGLPAAPGLPALPAAPGLPGLPAAPGLPALSGLDVATELVGTATGGLMGLLPI